MNILAHIGRATLALLAEVGRVTLFLKDAILQGLTRGGRTLAAGISGPDVFEPAQAIGCYRAICERFGSGRGVSLDTLVRDCGVAPRTARDLLVLFERRGLAHRIEGSSGRYAPSRPPREVTQAEVLRVGFALADGGAEASVRDEISELREAQVARLGGARFDEARSERTVAPG